MIVGYHEPVAWWLLALAPIVVLLHLLKTRRATVLVPSILLWLDAPEDARASAPFGRVRRPWLLALQLAALLSGVVAIARPYLPGISAAETHVVLTFDLSASMGATDVAPTRLDAARRSALALLGTLPKGTRVAVVAARTSPTLDTRFSDEFRQIVDAVRALEITDGGADLRAAVALAQAVSTRSRVAIHVFTDAGLADDTSDVVWHVFAPQMSDGPLPVNASLTDFRVVRSGADASAFVARVDVRNHADADIAGNVRLRLDGVTVDVQAVAIVGGGSTSVKFEGRARSDEDVAIEAQFDLADALAIDNRAYAVVPAVRTLPTLVVGEANVFRDTLLDLNPPITRERVSPGDYLPRDDTRLTVFHGAVPDPLPSGDVIILDSPGDLPFARRLGDAPVQALDWDPLHPLTRFVDFADFSLSRVSRFEVDERWEVLVSSGGVPVVMLRRAEVSRVVLLSFDPFDFDTTDFALRPSCVVFVSNLVAWSRGGLRRVPGRITVGDVVSFPAVRGGSQSIATPDGEIVEGVETWSGTMRAGVYTLLEHGTPIERFAVNIPAEESVPGDLASSIAPTTAGVRAAGHEIWRWFVLAALVLLTAEWWVYHRRA